MILKKIYHSYKLRKAIKKVKEHSVLIGYNHVFHEKSNIILQDGATKDNVILKDSCWAKGTITVQDKGIVIMHEYSKIGSSTKLLCVNRIELGAYSAVADGTIICDNNNHPINPEYRRRMRLTPSGSDMRMWKHSTNAPIIIGENCWIGTNVRICKGVNIGDNSIVAANSVVTKDVPANCIAAGNPAKIVKTNIEQIPAPTSCKEFNDYIADKNARN